MVLTRSQENLNNLNNIDQPANCSFTINLDNDNTRQASNTSQVVQNIQESQRRRSRGGRTRPTESNTDANVINGNDDSHIRNIVNESLNTFRNEMTGFITQELRSMFQNFNSNNSSNNNLTTNNSNTNTRNYDNSSNNSHQNNSEPVQDTFFTDKVLNIIRNWKIKFSGHNNQMSVDEFVYRVNILTTNNLRNDFELLCKHAHCLFEGKALEWYWRFHRQNNDTDWISLTDALRKQYKVDYDDFDILDEIRRRKQKKDENFHEYLDVIMALTDKLKVPMSDRDLCETLLRNIKTEIRHELLHLNITKVSQLRIEVRKHEKFVKDINATESRRTLKGHISEIINQDTNNDVSNDNVSDSGICAVLQTLKCWNCEKIGHTYMDCLETRRIFCYGCGMKDMYKPNCPNCRTKVQGNGTRDVRRK